MSRSILAATANPFDIQSISKFAETTECHIIWYLANPEDIKTWLRRAFEA
jgi:hypothetical protein